MATGAPALLRQARDIVAGAATDAAGLDAAFALLRRAAAADHRWPDGGLALHRVGYNLLAHWVRRADHSRAVAVADHVLQVRPLRCVCQNRRRCWGNDQKNAGSRAALFEVFGSVTETTGSQSPPVVSERSLNLHLKEPWRQRRNESILTRSQR